jgi:hypothetical protein
MNQNNVFFTIRFPLILCVFFSVTTSSFAQLYNTSLGLRAGNYNSGITCKHFLNATNAIEGIAFIFTEGQGVEFAGLYTYNHPIENISNFIWYAGGGAHIGFWGEGDNTEVFIGPDGILGIEYVFTEVPITLALDWHPFINLISDFETYFARIGLSVRYVF